MVPLKITFLALTKLAPAMITLAPTEAEVGKNQLTFGFWLGETRAIGVDAADVAITKIGRSAIRRGGVNLTVAALQRNCVREGVGERGGIDG
jgi:hypothetical protein